MKSDSTTNGITTNCCTTKTILSNLLNDYVPYRTTKSRHNLSRITNEIKRSMRKRDIIFLRARKSNSNTDWTNLGTLLLCRSHHHVKIILTMS